MIVLDFGSGETCKNDKAIVKRMIDELASIDSRKTDVVIKWQLFESVPADVVPLKRPVFRYAVDYAREMQYETTASVFDRESLDYLLAFYPRFVKIAARPHLYHMISQIPKTTPVIVSAPSVEKWNQLRIDFSHRAEAMTVLCCVAEYPASRTMYESIYGGMLHYGISDHTIGTRLYEKYSPIVWEKHYCLEDSTGPDAAAFAVRPAELDGVIG